VTYSSVTKAIEISDPEIAIGEQQIKHFATGRKAWLFSYDASSAQASANLFSLVRTCRVNDIEPYAYLNYLFEHLPAATTVEQIEAMLPWNLKAMLDAQKKSPECCSRPPPDGASTYSGIKQDTRTGLIEPHGVIERWPGRLRQRSSDPMGMLKSLPVFRDIELPLYNVNTRRYFVNRYAARARDDARMICVIAGITGIMHQPV
jgi:IS66 C-terminal element